MKENLHPKYQKCIVSCACGNEFEVHSLSSKTSVGICSQCHPFFTGKRSWLTPSRVDAGRRYAKAMKK